MLRSLTTESKPAPPAGRWSHPRREQLEDFMRGELSLPEVPPIVAHLLAGCTECLKVTRPLWERMKPRPKAGGGR